MENGASIRTSGVQGLKYTAILPLAMIMLSMDFILFMAQQQSKIWKVPLQMEQM